MSAVIDGRSLPVDSCRVVYSRPVDVLGLPPTTFGFATVGL